MNADCTYLHQDTEKHQVNKFFVLKESQNLLRPVATQFSPLLKMEAAWTSETL